VALFGHLAGEAITAVADPDGFGSGSAVDDLQLGPVLAGVFRELGQDQASARRLVALVGVLRQLPLPSFRGPPAAGRSSRRPGSGVRGRRNGSTLPPGQRLGRRELVQPRIVRQLLWWMLALDALAAEDRTIPAARAAAHLSAADRLTSILARAGEAAGYQLDKLEDGAGEAGIAE